MTSIFIRILLFDLETMKCNSILGIIDLGKFIEYGQKYSAFNLFDDLLSQRYGYAPTTVKMSDLYKWSTTSKSKYIEIKKGHGPPQKILREIPLTPVFYYSAALYDAEGGKSSSTLVSNSDEKIVRDIFQWYTTFQPTLEGIREIRVFMHVDEANKIFDLHKIDQLIKSGKITSKDSRNVNQLYSVLRAHNLIVDNNRLNIIIQKYLNVSPNLRGLIDKLRVKWDPLHKKTVFEIYYSNTLNPLIVSLTECILFKLPEDIKKGIKTPWIKWILPHSNFKSMGFINLAKNRMRLLRDYSKIQGSILGRNYLVLSRGRGDINIKSKLQVSPAFLFGLAHAITEKFSTGTPWELANYANFISIFGNPDNLIINVSTVLLAEEYTVLMKRLTTLFDKKGRLLGIGARHKKLEQHLAKYLFTLTNGKVPITKIRVNKIPYKEGIAVLMFHFPEVFADLNKLSDHSPKIKQAINEVIKEKGLGRHAGKASFHMEFKGTLQPLIRKLSEEAINDFCGFFNRYVV